MAHESTPKRTQPAAKDTFIMSRTDDGFRVYDPADPSRSYTVSGGPDESACTCPEFRYHEGDPAFRCQHIQVVLDKLGLDRPRSAADFYDRAEREAIQNENPNGNGLGQMVLKRSVSPDGRIDSLSVELSCFVGGEDDAKSRACDALRLQDEIVAGFLERNGRSKAESVAPQLPDGSQSARMLSIGGMTTKWGRRLYIALQSNGSTLRYFGSRKQIADAIVSAGYPNRAERIEEGQELDLACRVVTRPSDDGKYTNVEQVLPALQAEARRR